MPEAAYAAPTDLSAVLDAALVAELQSSAADVTAALNDASRELDSYLGSRYAIPIDIAASPRCAPILRQRTVAVAEYLFLSRKINVPPLAVEIAHAEYSAALAWSRDVAKKLADLEDAAPKPVEDPALTASRTPLLFGGDAPVFSGDEFLSF